MNDKTLLTFPERTYPVGPTSRRVSARSSPSDRAAAAAKLTGTVDVNQSIKPHLSVRSPSSFLVPPPSLPLEILWKCFRFSAIRIEALIFFGRGRASLLSKRGTSIFFVVSSGFIAARCGVRCVPTWWATRSRRRESEDSCRPRPPPTNDGDEQTVSRAGRRFLPSPARGL